MTLAASSSCLGWSGDSVRLSAVANERHLSILRSGVEHWNDWRKRAPDTRPDLTSASLEGAELNGAHLKGANLEDADLTAAHLVGAKLTRATLSNANLKYADLTQADLTAAHLPKAKLFNAKLGDALLNGAHLVQATLSRADLTGANLAGATLTSALMTHTNLTRADLTGATLVGADLNTTNLTNAILAGANLSTASLVHATVTGADLSEAVLSETIFADLDLSSAVHLDACKHFGPSSLDHRTLARSGRLPLAFLRGCGLPDNLIDYLPSLFEVSPIRFYSLFISFSTANQEFAERLHADLQAKGIRCWFAPHDIKGGRKIHEQIDEAIRVYDRLLLILSRESMESSWVKLEIGKARKKEVASKRRVLFPIAIASVDEIGQWEQFNADIGEDSAREIREYYLPDFSQWKDHDAYTRELARLVDALKSPA